jgi:hypothetical protein
MATNESYLPSEYNTGIYRGDDFSEMFNFTVDGEPFPLTNASGGVSIKDSMNNTLGTWTEENGLTFANNTLTWSINDEETAAFPAGSHKYDIEIEMGGQKRTYVKGIFTVVGDITN